MHRKKKLKKKDTLGPLNLCLPDAEVLAADNVVDVAQLVPDTTKYINVEIVKKKHFRLQEKISRKRPRRPDTWKKNIAAKAREGVYATKKIVN